MGVGRNWVMGVSVVIDRGEGNIMRVKETGLFSQVCLQRLSMQGGRVFETGLFVGVMVLDVVLVGIFCALSP